MFHLLSRSSIPDEALEYAGFVLTHCAAIADSNRHGELICPFALLERPEGRDVVAFESETQEEAVSKGWASLGEAQSKKISWAFGREGVFRGPDGKTTDVLTVSVWVSGIKAAYTVIQRFGRRDDEAIYLIGVPELLKHGGKSAQPVERWNTAALERGICNHPQGERWRAWRDPA